MERNRSTVTGGARFGAAIFLRVPHAPISLHPPREGMMWSSVRSAIVVAFLLLQGVWSCQADDLSSKPITIMIGLAPGGIPMMADVLTGRVDFAVVTLSTSRPFLVDKKLRALALDADARWSGLPDVPLLAELG
jgi:tripartite-type tricarboxylate transporter receptor subunit TctC